jgi:tetratricopeptide (TPR) repeat protein
MPRWRLEAGIMRRTVLFTGLLALPLALAAQGTAPATPTSCMQDVSAWYSSSAKAAQDSAGLPGGKAPDYSALFSTRTAKLKECAARFSVERTSGADLIALASLDSQAGLDSLAAIAVNRRLAEPGLSESDRAAALVAMIHALTRPDTLLIARAEPYMKQLDAMSDAVIIDKLSAHSSLDGEYRYLDVNDRIRQHSLAIIALGKKLKAASAGDRSPGTVSAFTLLGAYANLGEVYADLGQVDSTLRVLDQAIADHPEISAKDADAYLKPERERYELVGKPAMALEAGHWLNAPAGTRNLAPKGKVTVIEFTAHWCIPCRNSYPAMAAMADTLGKQGVQFAFATEFYGYLGAKKNLDADAEFAADREYFVVEHGIHFPVAIADRPPTPKPGQPYVPEPNSGRYRVGGIPQTVIIDRNGIVRRILTGWDTGNAERMPVLLAALLKEQTTSQTP